MQINPEDLVIQVVSPSNYGVKRKTPARACVKCHARKVKCDAGEVPPGHPCSACLKSNEECRIASDRRFRQWSDTDLAAESREPKSVWNQGASSERQVNRLPNSATSFTSTVQIDQLSTGSALSSVEDATPESSQRSAGAVAPSGNEVRGDWALLPPPRKEPETKRFESFAQDALGSYAPSFTSSEGSRSRYTSPWNASSSTDWNVSRVTNVHLENRPNVDIERQFLNLDAADMEYLRGKGAFDLPPKPLQEEMITAYFDHVNPVAPVINKTEFMQAFYNNTASPLLLFAIFTAGCKACRNPILIDQSGTKFATGLKFWKATKAILDTGLEESKVAHIQAYLLLTWWWDKKDDGGKNMRGCAVNAINVAQSIGMNRWQQYPKDPIQRGLWKRIWWGCVIRDATVSTAHDVPLMLNNSDFDVPPLTADDFAEQSGPGSAGQIRPYSTEEISFYIHQARLTESMGAVHTRHWRQNRVDPVSVGSIGSREAVIGSAAVGVPPAAPLWPGPDDFSVTAASWYSSLPPELQYNVDDIQGHRFWPAYLHMLFFTTVCINHRQKSVTKASNARDLVEKHWNEARGVAAATMITKIIRNFRAHGQLLHCPGLLTNAIFNSLIYCLIEGQSPDSDSRKKAQQKYSLCLNSLYEFSQQFVSASMVYQLFLALQPQMYRLPEQTAGLGGATDPEGSSSLYEPVLPGELRSPGAADNETMRLLLQSSAPVQYSFNNDFAPISTSANSGQLQEFSLNLADIPPEFFAFNHELPNSMGFGQWYNFYGLEGS